MAGLPLLAVSYTWNLNKKKGDICLHFLTACFMVSAVVVTIQVKVSSTCKKSDRIFPPFRSSPQTGFSSKLRHKYHEAILQ
jgi:hypothetical protein